jgi:hypothetical protein
MNPPRTIVTSLHAAGRAVVRPRHARLLLLLGLTLLVSGLAFAQRRGRWGGWRTYVDENQRSARAQGNHSTETPMWTNTPGFERDVFTFVRVRYHAGGRGGRGDWTTDYADSDLNLSYRLQQMTSMKVNPDPYWLRLSEAELLEYPFLYIVEPGALQFTEEEAIALRKYLLNGGFLMFDDFWGRAEWANVEENMRLVFPDREFVELQLDHSIYQRPFPIRSKDQVPNVGLGTQSQFDGRTWERWDAQEVHHRAIFDDYQRMMVIATHNTDNGDGWEREGENDYYFHNFSEKIAYPLGINIIFYVMTH